MLLLKNPMRQKNIYFLLSLLCHCRTISGAKVYKKTEFFCIYFRYKKFRTLKKAKFALKHGKYSRIRSFHPPCVPRAIVCAMRQYRVSENKLRPALRDLPL
ncbi:MAG: hypothetical protein RIR11_822 [Bacteroidota bacterium]